MTIYDEFDDVDKSHLPWVGSAKAVAEIRRLVGLHGLGYQFNPGGATFEKPGFKCHILCGDDVEDLNKLRAALAEFETKETP